MSTMFIETRDAMRAILDPKGVYCTGAVLANFPYKGFAVVVGREGPGWIAKMMRAGEAVETATAAHRSLAITRVIWAYWRRVYEPDGQLGGDNHPAAQLAPARPTYPNFRRYAQGGSPWRD